MISLERIKRALVVDDSVVTAKIVSGFLRQAGVREVDMAHSGDEALAMLAERAYALIVSDFVMHPMTGMQLWRRVTSRPDLRHIPFLLMTTQADNMALTAEDRAKLRAYAVKPFDAQTLTLRVAEVLATHQEAVA